MSDFKKIVNICGYDLYKLKIDGCSVYLTSGRDNDWSVVHDGVEIGINNRRLLRYFHSIGLSLDSSMLALRAVTRAMRYSDSNTARGKLSKDLEVMGL